MRPGRRRPRQGKMVVAPGAARGAGRAAHVMRAAMIKVSLTLLAGAGLAAAPALGQGAPAALTPGAKPPETSYILRGFRLSGVPGVDQDALVDALKQKPGDRITPNDVDADTQQLGEALKTRNFIGRLFTTLAVKDGRIWVLFDFQPAEKKPPRYFAAQDFDGNLHVSSAALATAIAFKPGDLVNADRLNAAERAITAAYATSAPAVKIHISGKIRTTPTGQVTVMWHIAEIKD